MGPIVVKLGGSLDRDPLLRSWLQLLAGRGGGTVVIVPGGGAFADEVRAHQEHWGFDDLVAHNMAILAMMQSALLLASLAAGLVPATTPADIARRLQAGEVVVWSPGSWLCDEPGDMTHWGATSDSLAAWLAQQLGASHLVVVKSCEIQPDLSLAAQAARGVVDAGFCRLAAAAACPVRLLNKLELPAMRQLLEDR